MLEMAAGWLRTTAPGLDAYELTALSLGALALTLVLLLISLLALVRVGRLVSDTMAVARQTRSLESENVRLSAELKTLRDSVSLLAGEPGLRRAAPSATPRPRRTSRPKTLPSYTTKRPGEGRGGPLTFH